MANRTGLIALISTVLSLGAQEASAEEFDRALLAGRWGELFGSEQPSCHDAIIFQHELSKDGSELTTHFIRNWPLAELSGNQYSVERYRVLSTTKNTITFERSDKTDENSPKVWELIFVAPDMYKIRADGWETDEGDFVRRKRCL